jgi:hypothetical protein
LHFYVICINPAILAKVPNVLIKDIFDKHPERWKMFFNEQGRTILLQIVDDLDDYQTETRLGMMIPIFYQLSSLDF